MKSAEYAVVIVTYNRIQLLRECVVHAVSQTSCPKSIIIVDNASTDETDEYLESLKQHEYFEVIRLPQNIGGAGGFAKGIEKAMEKNVDCVLLIDDDAIIADDYMEKILSAMELHPQYKAFAGVVKTGGKIDPFHRRDFRKPGLTTRNVQEKKYSQDYFTCDSVSFCGMVVNTELIREIGLPHAEYFIFFDDTEYSLRILRYNQFLVVTGAVLNHKTKTEIQDDPRRYGWKDYYAVRNRILMVREHGSVVDRVINFIDIFIHIIFRNWIFGLTKRDHYDWKYERSLVREAIRDSNGESLRNVVIKREGRESYRIEYSEICKTSAEQPFHQK